MSYDPHLTHFHSLQVENLLRNNVKIGQSLDLGNKRSGTAVGFAKKYIGRDGLHHKYAGVYIDFATVIAAPRDGGPDELLAFNLGSKSKIADIHVRIRDLPETPFWEGDVVSFAPEVCTDPRSAEERFVVESIYYAVTPMQVSMRSLSGFSAGGPLSAMRLIERGRIWKFEHCEPLNFSDIEAEAKFFQKLGMSHKLEDAGEVARLKDHAERIEFRDAKEEERFYTSRGESHGANYVTDLTVPFADAIRAVQRGEADEMKLKDKKNLTYVLIKYEDRSFSHRMREYTLKKFDVFEARTGCEA